MKKHNQTRTLLSIFAICAGLLFSLIPSYAEETEHEEEPVSAADESLSENDKLLEGYIAQAFGIPFEDNSTAPSDSLQPDSQINLGSRLSGLTGGVYNVLKTYIAETAAGERASTVYEISYEQAGLTKTKWTAAELGVSDILSSEAQEKLEAIIDIDSYILHDALLYDCPYDLYWYDKTAGYSSSGGYFTRYYSSDGGYAEITGNITFQFCVADEYRAGTCKVDTTIAKTIQTSVANAKNIVAKYRTSSDYEKLRAYRKEICDLVSYNYSAAQSYYMPYGNPWQLIWVFDGDSSTNVVCEGYSKAFQYLCDQTEFVNDICCYCVCGNGHMWNIVSMDDGYNYLVDVTNCDSGSIGADEKLFLVGTSNGSCTSGYTFNLDYGSLTYKYYLDMFDIYTEEELTLAPSNYTPGAALAISLSPSTAYVNVGDTVVLKAEVTPETANHNISWSTSDSSIASIDTDGTVHGKRAGTATITVKSANGKTASSKVKVLFTDVPDSGVYYSGAVYWAVNKGITYGFTDEDGLARCFGPERNCTRAQMVTFLWRLAGKPNPKSTSCKFTDIKTSDYYYKAVLWAAEKGITAGYADDNYTTFRPDDTCLREHAVTFLWRYAGWPTVTTENTFTDVSTDDYYYKAVLWAAAKNITKGYADDDYATFRPKNDCLREHIVTFMYRFAN